MSNEFFLIKFYKLLIIIFFIFFFNYFNLFNSFIIILDWYINNLILSYSFAPLNIVFLKIFIYFTFK